MSDAGRSDGGAASHRSAGDRGGGGPPRREFAGERVSLLVRNLPLDIR
jgi:hypothetical protein